MTNTLHSQTPSPSSDGFDVEERSDPVVNVLESARITVREGFVRGVMARLPEVSWGRRRVPWGLLAACAAIVMAAGASILLSGSEAGTGITAVDSLVELMSTGLMAGAGFLAASWGGMRTTLGSALRESPMTIAAVTVVAVGMAFALVRLVGQRREAKVSARQSDRD